MPQTDFDRAACEGKVAFKDKTLAEKVIKRPHHHKRDNNRQVYRCPVCRQWHIGRRTK